MKRLLLALALAVPVLAQVPPETDFYATTFTRAACIEWGQVLGQPTGGCVPHANVFISTTDRSIRAFEVTVNYLTTENKPSAKTQIVSAAQFGRAYRAATTLAYVEIEDMLTVKSIVVISLTAKSGVEH